MNKPVKFQSRIDAGQKIAERLIGLKLDLFGESGSQDIAVLAVPRGGIIIGDIVASGLASRLDVEHDGCPLIIYEVPNEEIAENVILIEKGEYKCRGCNNTIAQYLKFSQ